MKTSIREFPELVKETLVPLGNLDEHYPVPISRPSAERAWRKGRFGVRLETIFLNGKRYTSIEAISRYINRTQRTGDEIPSAQTPSMSKRDIVAARKKYNLPPSGKNGVADENN
jgi:hypothetical protein